MDSITDCKIETDSQTDREIHRQTEERDHMSGFSFKIQMSFWLMEGKMEPIFTRLGKKEQEEEEEEEADEEEEEDKAEK